MRIHHRELLAVLQGIPVIRHIPGLIEAIVKHPIAAFVHKFFLGFYFTGLMLYWLMQRLTEAKDPNITRWEHVKQSAKDYAASLKLSAHKEWNENTWNFFAAAAGMLTSLFILIGLFVYGQVFFWASTVCVAGCYYAWHKAAVPDENKATYQHYMTQASAFMQFVSVVSFGAALVLLDIIQATSIALPFGHLFAVAILTSVGLACAFVSTVSWVATFFLDGDQLVNPLSKIKVPVFAPKSVNNDRALTLGLEPEFQNNNNPYLPSKAHKKLQETDRFDHLDNILSKSTMKNTAA